MNKLEMAISNLEQELIKAKEMPIGTVSMGRKKVAKGKWVKIEDKKKTKSKNKKDKEFESRMKYYDNQNKMIKELDQSGYDTDDIEDGRIPWGEVEKIYEKRFKKKAPTKNR